MSQNEEKQEAWRFKLTYSKKLSENCWTKLSTDFHIHYVNEYVTLCGIVNKRTPYLTQHEAIQCLQQEFSDSPITIYESVPTSPGKQPNIVDKDNVRPRLHWYFGIITNNKKHLPPEIAMTPAIYRITYMYSNEIDATASICEKFGFISLAPELITKEQAKIQLLLQYSNAVIKIYDSGEATDTIFPNP